MGHRSSHFKATDATKTSTFAGGLSVNGNFSFGDASADTFTMYTDSKFYLRDTGLYVYSSADGQLDLIGDTVIKLTAPTIELEGSSALTLDGDVTIDGAHTLTTGTGAISILGDATFGTTKKALFRDSGIYLNSSSDGVLDIVSDTTIAMSGAITMDSTLAVDGLITLDNITSIYINPTAIADTSVTPIKLEYNYLGASNTGNDIDNYGIRSAITQTSSNAQTLAKRGYMMGIRSDVTVNGYADDAYSFYARMTVAGTSVVNQLYGLNSVWNHGAFGITMDSTGNIAGIGISMNGTGDVTCGGAGYGKVSGMYISWNETNAMTVDTCGVYLGVVSGSTLDSGYRVNASGTLGSSFHSYNSSGTMTNVIKVEGAHSFFADFDAATTCATTTESGAATNIKGNILVKTVAGGTGYINVYGSAGS